MLGEEPESRATVPSLGSPGVYGAPEGEKENLSHFQGRKFQAVCDALKAFTCTFCLPEEATSLLALRPLSRPRGSCARLESAGALQTFM